jgi:hypothetical protein
MNGHFFSIPRQIGSHIKKHWFIVLFFVLLTIFRMSLITKGHLSESDEFRYLNALYFWVDVFHGRYLQAIEYFFRVGARPGFVLVSLFPSLLQIVFTHFNLISPAHLNFFDLPSFFNVLVTVANGIIFYGILNLLVLDRSIAAAGTIVYSFLVNTNVYIRHLYPFDDSLLCFFIVIFLILSAGSRNFRYAAICGALSALGCLIYPGYYSLALVVTVFLAVFVRFDVKALVPYLTSFLYVILGFELLSKMAGGVSYFSDCWAVSQVINHGSFAEGFLFITRYLTQVEGLIGAALLLLFLIYLGYFLPKDRSPCKWLLMAAVAMYSVHAILGLLFFKMVFYGRALHMYFPFLVLASARVLSFFPQQKWRRTATMILLGCSAVSFVQFAHTYTRLSYPTDVYFEYLKRVPVNKVLFLQSGDKVDPAEYRNYSAVALNFVPFFDVKQGYADIVPPPHMALVVDKPNPLNFSFYTFENYAPRERSLLKERKYPMRIYVDPYKRQTLDDSRVPCWERFYDWAHPGHGVFTPLGHDQFRF